MNIFRGAVSPDRGDQRVFGGQVAGQAWWPAPPSGRPRRALHAQFLRPAMAIPIIYGRPLRDGHSFSTRRVRAVQHGRSIFTLSASFRSEDGFDHQFECPRACPTSLPDFRADGAVEGRLHDTTTGPDPSTPLLRDRAVGAPRDLPVPERVDACQRRAPRRPGAAHLRAACASDALLDTSLQPHGSRFTVGEVFVASLDHAMWFHRPFRADEWLLYAQDTPSASGGRGLGRGLVYSRDGRLVASVVQEGLIRPMRSHQEGDR